MSEREKRQIIEDAANQFRDQWNRALAEKTAPPKVGPFLDRLLQQHGSALRDDLLSALVEVDMYRRVEAGEQVTPQDYHDQFPGAAQMIDDLFNAQQSPDADNHQVSQNATTEKPDPNAPISNWPRSFSDGDTIDEKYKLIEPLGKGGMGTVWKAIRLRDAKDVALKLARRDRLTSEEEMEFARCEAGVLVNLKHDNLVEVLDAQVDREPVYLAMQFVPGGLTLADLIKSGPLPAMRAATIMAQVAEAVAELHAQDPEIYHRDLKPANVLMQKEKPLVADLGLALTEHGQLSDHVRGTPLYMSPEQLRGEKDLYKTPDIWALGAILYECLSGKRPYATVEAIEHPTSSCQDVRGIVVDVPDPLAELCERCLDKDKDNRPRTAGEFAKILRDCIPEQDDSETGIRDSRPSVAHELPIPTNVEGELSTFTGREKELDEIHRHLNQGSSLALCQLAVQHRQGGVGKTELAIAYGRRRYLAGDYPAGVFIIRGDGDWNRELASLASELRLSTRDDDDDERIADRVRQTLASGERALLIVDNTNDAGKWRAALQRKLVPGGACRCLITTRCDHLSGLPPAAMYPLHRLDRDDAVKLLGKFRDDASTDENRAVVERIADLFSSLTVGLTITGVYMWKVGCGVSWAECENKLTQVGLKSLEAMEDKTAQRPDLYELRVKAIFDELLEEVEPPVRRALEYAALLPDGQIPRFWLSQLLINDPEMEFDANAPGGEPVAAARRVIEQLEDRFEFLRPAATALAQPAADSRQDVAALAETVPFADASTSQASETSSKDHAREITARDWRAPVGLHGFLRDHLRGWLEDQEQQQAHPALCKQITALFQHRVAECSEHQPTYKPVLSELAPLTTLATDLADEPEAALTYSYLAMALYKLNRLAEAEPLMRRALFIEEQSYSAEHPNVALRLNGLTQLLLDTNRLAEAEQLMRRALAIDEQSYGEHTGVANSLTNLASLLQLTNRLAEAEPLMRRALAIDEQSHGPEHAHVGVRLNNLASLLIDRNRLAEAEPLMRRALAIDEQSYGEHTGVANSLTNLASLLIDTNRLVEAEPLVRRALAVEEQSYGPDHPRVAYELNNLADLLAATNRLKEAETLMHRALLIFEQSYGTEHPHVARVLNNLAMLLPATNRLAHAEPLVRLALNIDEQSYGPDHPAVACSLNNLAELLTATNRLAEAEPLMRRTLQIFIRFFKITGHSHRHMKAAFANCVTTLACLDLDEAEVDRRLETLFEIPESFEPILPEVERLLGPAKPVAKALAELDEQFRAKADKYATVYFLPLTEPVVPHLGDLLGPDRPLAEILGELNQNYRQKGKYPSLYFLPLDQPISPHLDELLGPLETRTNTPQERDSP